MIDKVAEKALRAEHTPGDWQSRNDVDWREIIGNADGGYGDGGSEVRFTPICCVDTANTAEASKNVSLICAAPDMLEALITLVNSVAWSPQFDRALNNARKVIAQAEGAYRP